MRGIPEPKSSFDNVAGNYSNWDISYENFEFHTMDS